MASITAFTEASTSTPAEVGEGGAKTYTRVFHVEADGVVGPAAIFAHASCPRWGDVYTSDAGDLDADAVCVGLSARRRDETPYVWAVEARYSTVSAEAGGAGGGEGGVGAVTGGPVNPADPTGGAESPEGGGESGGDGGAATSEAPPTVVENPLLRPAKFSWSTIKVPTPLLQDRAGDAVVNSAGCPFDPPVEYEAIRPVLTVSKNMPLATINANFIQNRTGHINSADWMGFPAKTLKLDVSASSEFENGVWYWATTFTFECKIDGWNPVEILDAGYQEIDEWVLRDPAGSPLSRPALLNGLGLILGDGDDPVFLPFTVYGEFDFAELGLF